MFEGNRSVNVVCRRRGKTDLGDRTSFTGGNFSGSVCVLILSSWLIELIDRLRRGQLVLLFLAVLEVASDVDSDKDKDDGGKADKQRAGSKVVVSTSGG